MPQWILYMLAGAGACFFLMMLLDAVTELLKSAKDRRIRIKSLKQTVYLLEGDIIEQKKLQDKQGEVLGDMWKAVQLMRQQVVEIQQWRSHVSEVTDHWKRQKEAGPDGP